MNEVMVAGMAIPAFVCLAAGAFLLDLLIGDPRWLPHPVVGMGRWIAFLEKRWNRGSARRMKGIALTVVTVGLVYGICFLIVKMFYGIHPFAGMLLEMYLIFTTIAAKSLKDAALAVSRPLLAGDLAAARKAVGNIVGRDTERMNERDIARAAVETVAENTVDGITSPAFWALIGGAPAAMAYRAVNTLDSMVGYKNERYREFGWASARLDDAANWVPARLSALCMWLGALFIPRSRWRTAWKIALRDAPAHPSPNSGWPEAMAAGLLGVQLGGQNFYGGIASFRATMGDPVRELQVRDIVRTIAYMHGAWIGFIVMMSAIAFVVNDLM